MNANNKYFFIGISGGSGSGKTTLAKMLVNRLGSQRASILSQDSYYRDLSKLEIEHRKSVDFDHPDALEWDMLRNHLLKLKSNVNVQVPIYDFSSHTRSGFKTFEPYQYLIIEGHLLFYNHNIRDLLDFKIFLHNDIDILLLRRISRDIKERGRSLDEIILQYLNSVRNAYFNYVEPCRQWADKTIVFDNNNELCINEIIKNIEL